MDFLLAKSFDDPVDLTYVGIGSCPYGGQPSPKEDQLVPSCFDQRLGLEKRKMRCIHFDPAFPSQKEELVSYFQTVSAVKELYSPCGEHWTSETLDVYLLPLYIEYDEHQRFFQRLVQIILETKGKLLVQDYTGRSLRPLDICLFQSVQDQELYKRRVLLDMSFGTDQGCSTDMTLLQPFYDESGNLLNFWWISAEETLRWCGVSSKLDTLLRRLCKERFLETLSRIHVDYRRALRGDPPFSPSVFYNKDSSPEHILSVLESEIQDPVRILQRLRVLTQDQVQTLEKLFQEASQQSPYTWYDSVRKMVEP